MVVGAVCCSAMFARQMHVSVRWPQYVVLAGSVWLIYTLDHLLDAFRKPFLVSPRHRFHKQYWKTLTVLGLLVLFLTAGLAFTQLPLSVVHFGIVLGASLAGYLALAHFIKLPYFFKEGWVALLYTIGVWGSIAVQSLTLRLADWLTAGVFGIIILQQAMMLAWYETHEDTSQQMASLMQQQNSKRLHGLLKILIMMAVVASGVGFAWLEDSILDRAVWLTLLAITSMLAAITTYPDFFRPRYAYRLWSDGILMLPLWLLVAFPSVS